MNRRGWLERWFVTLLVVAGLAPMMAMASQVSSRDDILAPVEAVASELVGQLANGNLIGAYDRLHPDARNLVALEGFAAWIADRGSDPGKLTRVEVASTWVWGATDKTYDDVATVSGQGARGTPLTFVAHEGRWRWIPDWSRTDLTTLATAGDDPFGIASTVPDPYIAIDRYWARAFSLAARPYMPLADVVEVTDATLDSACGSDVSIALVLIYYCEFDQTIYVDPAFRADIVREMGDGAWMMIVAHEWGHHLQWVVGVNLLPPDPELQGGMYVIESEMLADCLAGVFLQDQLARGVLDAEAIRQAEAVAMAYGDRPNTGFDHPTAHGFSRQRLTSLRTGLEDGITGCHILPVSPLS